MRQLTEQQVKDHVHNIVGYGGDFIYSNHARDRMEERGYTFRNLCKIISAGSLVDIKKTPKPETGNTLLMATTLAMMKAQ